MITYDCFTLMEIYSHISHRIDLNFVVLFISNYMGVWDIEINQTVSWVRKKVSVHWFYRLVHCMKERQTKRQGVLTPFCIRGGSRHHLCVCHAIDAHTKPRHDKRVNTNTSLDVLFSRFWVWFASLLQIQ